jgi:hypothetical protein
VPPSVRGNRNPAPIMKTLSFWTKWSKTIGVTPHIYVSSFL